MLLSLCQRLLLRLIGELIWVLSHYTQVCSYAKVRLGGSVPQDTIMRDSLFGLKAAILSKLDSWVVLRELRMITNGIQVDLGRCFEILHELLELQAVRLANYFLWFLLLLMRGPKWFSLL